MPFTSNPFESGPFLSQPRDFQHLAMALSMGEGPRAGLEGAVSDIQRFAPECVPDIGRAREALTAWGLKFEAGEPIVQMFTKTPALKVALPPGWTISRRGGGGHVEMLDARGASRIRWHIHGWDPVSLTLNERFGARRSIDLSPSDAVVQVMDGETVIHTVTVKYPHPRINSPMSDGSPYYKNGYPGEDAGWTKEMCIANSEMEQAAYKAAEAWLKENRPGYQDYIQSWSL